MFFGNHSEEVSRETEAACGRKQKEEHSFTFDKFYFTYTYPSLHRRVLTINQLKIVTLYNNKGQFRKNRVVTYQNVANSIILN